jgi:hypothetical protein
MATHKTADKMASLAPSVSMTRFEAFLAKCPTLHRHIHTAEWFVDKATLWVLGILTLLIIAEFTIDLAPYEHYVTVLDIFIISFFITDLSFKYAHTTTLLRFVRLYWLEIIAILPFYYLFRFFSGVGAIGESVAEAQKITHEAMLTRESEIIAREAKVLREARLFREAELLGRESEFGSRIVRSVQYSYRLLVARLNLAHRAISDHAIKHGGHTKHKPLHIWALSFLVIWSVLGIIIVSYEAYVLGWSGILAIVNSQSVAGSIIVGVLVFAYCVISFVIARMVWQRKAGKQTC